MRHVLPRTIAALAVVATAVGSALVYSSLPARMATHWNAAGEVDGTMGRGMGAFFMVGVMLFTLGTLYVAPYLDPKKQNIEAFRGAYEWFAAGIMLFLGYVHGLTLAWNLGYEIPIGVGIIPAVSGLFVGLGYLIEKVGQNWTVGIRTPWTLSDEHVWKATHKRGALAFKLAGVVALGGLLAPDDAVWFILVPALLAAAYTVGYSFVAYRRRHPEN